MPWNCDKEFYGDQRILAALKQKLEHIEARFTKALSARAELHRTSQVFASKRWGDWWPRPVCLPIASVFESLSTHWCNTTSCAWTLRSKHKASLVTFNDLVVRIWNQPDITHQRTFSLNKSNTVGNKITARPNRHSKLKVSRCSAPAWSPQHLPAKDLSTRQK